MERGILVIFTCLATSCLVGADIYLHNPRGSNNRLNEKSANRANAKRLFDSQNNNRGGYNVGDKSDKAAGNDQEQQYRMKYFQSGPWQTQSEKGGQSFLNIEWTNQHGCGGNEDTSPQKQNCGLVLQYMCQDDDNTAAGSQNSLRDGHQTNTQPYTKPNKNNIYSRDGGRSDVKPERGQHEIWDWYNKCNLRQRNLGLFLADQKLGVSKEMGWSGAIYTRQNPTGNQYGYECPEERDYYPYWHPTPWVDIAVLAENASLCSHYQSKSFNVQPYYECIHQDGWSKHTNKKDCEADNGDWLLIHSYLEIDKSKTSRSECEQTKTSGLTYHWAIPYDSHDGYGEECLVKLEKPQCMEAPWSRSNHLGNGHDGQPLTYNWTLPHFPSGKTKRCVFRIRYNISTDDYDPFNTDSRHNDDFPTKSPIQQNPYVYVMNQVSPLRLAINTAQYGRVFQDRSHVFELHPRPPNGIPDDVPVHNLNVRGKRGNIVQVYPAVEYDFVPTELRIRQGDLVHVQWTGSNTHNNGAPGGDGQTGAAGEGKEGTDRNNFVEMTDRSGNFPTPFEKSTLWDGVDVVWIYHGEKDLDKKDLAVNMASSGYYKCSSTSKCNDAADGTLSNVLDNAPASYEGAVLKFTKKGTFHIMCTRNNNFSNRSQKAAIIVE